MPQPDVIVTLPEGMGAGTQIGVTHEPWGTEVRIREHHRAEWLPLHHSGGTFEVRPTAPEPMPTPGPSAERIAELGRLFGPAVHKHLIEQQKRQNGDQA